MYGIARLQSMFHMRERGTVDRTNLRKEEENECRKQRTMR